MYMSLMEIVAKARADVAQFENPLFYLLQPCSESAADAIRENNDPLQFTARIYGFVRRVEAAAAERRDENVPAVIGVASLARELVPRIEEMQKVVEKMDVISPLEEAGEHYLLDTLRWALWVIQERLPEWGYGKNSNS